MDIVDVLREAGVETHTEGSHTRPGWVQFDCPLCEGHLYMGFNTVGKYCNCWRCGPQKLMPVLQKLLKRPYPELVALVASLAPMPQVKRDSGVLRLPSGVKPMGAVHRKYLRQRGYNPKRIEQLWGVQGIGANHRLQWRLFIPIHYKGEIVSWTTRSISDEVQTRYVSASLEQESRPHKSLLYGEDFARHSCIVVEGPFDVWRIGPGAVGTCGVGFSRAQVLKMSKYSVRVICFDNEPRAQKRANDLCDILSVFNGDTYNVVLSGKDPGVSPEAEIEVLRKRFL